jgi:hypothetical protein
MDGDHEVARVVSDAARLVGRGEIVVFGSAALAFWMQSPPRSKDVDIWCEPAENGHVVVALMGELSWYHDKHGLFVVVWAPVTFAAPNDWRDRSKVLSMAEHPNVSVRLPRPHDVAMAKLERMEVKDREHVRAILAEFPMDDDRLEHLVRAMPHRQGSLPADRVARFESGFAELQAMRAQQP